MRPVRRAPRSRHGIVCALPQVFVFDALGRKAVDEASAGDIVVVAGMSDFNIGDTLVDMDTPMPLEPIEVEQPTMSITMGVNKSPFAGKSGAKLLTGRNIRDRLAKELEVNVALQGSMSISLLI